MGRYFTDMKATYLLLCSAILLASCTESKPSENKVEDSTDLSFAINDVTVLSGYWTGQGMRSRYFSAQATAQYLLNPLSKETEIRTYNQSEQQLTFHMSKTCLHLDSCILEISRNDSIAAKVTSTLYEFDDIKYELDMNPLDTFSLVVVPIFRGIRNDSFLFHFVP